MTRNVRVYLANQPADHILHTIVNIQRNLKNIKPSRTMESGAAQHLVMAFQILSQPLQASGRFVVLPPNRPSRLLTGFHIVDDVAHVAQSGNNALIDVLPLFFIRDPIIVHLP